MSAPAPDESAGILIRRASVADAEAILRIQKEAYQSEAELYRDWSIAPLRQSLEEMIDDMSRMTVLAACLDGVCAGSVRGALGEDGVCRIGRLIVAPEHQGRGIGTRLLREMEAEFPSAACYELFTGSRSERNLRLYARAGYVEFMRKTESPALTLIYLRKTKRR